MRALFASTFALLLGAAFPGTVRGEDGRDYAELVRRLPVAQREGKVDSLFIGFLDSLGRSRSGKDRSASPLVRRWVADAARETDEETRLWYSLGMNEVRGLGFGGVSLSHFKIRPGEDAEITWNDPKGDSPPPRDTRVELAVREPSGPGAKVRYRHLETGPLRKEGAASFWRRKLEKPGLYRVTLVSVAYFQQAYVQVSDLDILIKEDGDRFLVWGASPGNRLKPPYRVRADGPGGWKADAATDARGLAFLKVPKDPAFRKAVRVMLEKDGHAAYSGRSPREAEAKRSVVWLFTDRPRYRPGDRLHIRGVIKTLVGDRGLEDGRKGPLRVSVFDSRDAPVAMRDIAVDAWGNFGDSLDLGVDAALGHWRVRTGRPDTGVVDRSDDPFGVSFFDVEEYRKPGFRIEAESRWIGSRGKLSLRVAARYPDGSPVGRIPVEIKWRGGPPFQEYDPLFGHTFGDWEDAGSRSHRVLRVDTLRLDARGRGGLVLDPPDAGRSWRAEMTARNRDGHTVRETVRVRKSTNDLGIRIEADRFRYEAGNLGRFRITAREADGRPRRGKVWLTFKAEGKPAFDTTLDFDDKGRAYLAKPLERTGHWSALADLDPERPDSPVSEVSFYVARLVSSGEELPIRIDALPLGAGVPDSARFRLQGEWGDSPILATLEGPSLAAWAVLPTGDGARIAAALALPRDAAHRARIMAAFPGPHGWEADSITIDLPDSARLLRASLESAAIWKPGERFKGRIRVTDARGRPAKVRFSVGVADEALYQGTFPSRDSAGTLIPARLRNQVRSLFGERSEEHLWASTGAIRHPTGTRALKTEFDRGWDPYDSERYRWYKYRTRRERTRGARLLFGRALPRPGWLDGPDAEYISAISGERSATEGAVPGSLRTDFNDRAWWASMLETDASGYAAVEFPWPDDLALWRLTARGAGPGASLLDFRDSLVTRLDLSVRLASPRAFSVGDSALLTAIISNGTDRTLPAEILLASGDSSVAALADSGRRSIRLAPGTTPVRFAVRIRKAGRAEFRVSLRAGESGDGEVRSVPVMEPGTRVVTAGSGRATRIGGSRQGNPSPDRSDPFPFRLDAGYRPGSAQVEAVLYSVPALALAGPVENLLEYPYGCVEQTLSRFVPMLQVLGVLRKLGIRRENLERRMLGIADSGLTRLESLLSKEGGWGWWGNGNFDPYLTGLVVEGMHRAARADLPPELRRRAERLRDRGLAGLKRTVVAGDLDPERAVSVARAMSIALPFEAWKGLFEQAWPARSQLSVGALAQLSTLARQSGVDSLDREALALLKQRLYIPDRSEEIGYGYYPETSYWSLAEALIALADAGREPETAARIAAWLHRRRQGEGWGSTRGTARVLEALSRLDPGPLEAASGRVHLEINGRRLRSDSLAPGSDGAVYLKGSLSGAALDSALRPGDNTLEFIHEGAGGLHYSARVIRTVTYPALPPAAKPGPISITRAYRKVRYEAGPRGSRVRKTDPGGRTFRLGEEAEVTLEVETPAGGGYLLLEDPIPGGMEFQPAEPEDEFGFGDLRRYRGDHVEARGDRVAIFQSRLPPGRSVFHYSLRAATRGRFLARPARVELMYQPEINAESGPSALTVRP